MNKRRLSKLEQGQGTTVFGRLLLTRRQCRNLLKWVLLALGYLAVQVLQDVDISRVRLFGGCPDVTVAYLLLACVLFSLLSSYGLGKPEHLLWCLSANFTAAAAFGSALVYGRPFHKLARRLTRSGGALAG